MCIYFCFFAGVSGLSHTHACSTSDKQINVRGAKTKAAYPEPSLESLMGFFLYICVENKKERQRARGSSLNKSVLQFTKN